VVIGLRGSLVDLALGNLQSCTVLSQPSTVITVLLKVTRFYSTVFPIIEIVHWTITPFSLALV
jgi:hypothetical protein